MHTEPSSVRRESVPQSTTWRTASDVREQSDSAKSSTRRRMLPQLPVTGRCDLCRTDPHVEYSPIDDGGGDSTGLRVRREAREARRVVNGESSFTRVERLTVETRRPMARKPRVSSQFSRSHSKSVSSSGEEAEVAQRRRRTCRTPSRRRSPSFRASESDESEVGVHTSRRRGFGDFRTPRKEVMVKTGVHLKRESSQGKLEGYQTE